MPEPKALTLLQLSERVLRAMNRLGAPYAIGGGFGVNAWVGKEMIRPTIDLDLHARLSNEEITCLCALLEEGGVQAFHSADLVVGSGRVQLRRLLCPPEILLDFVACDDPYGSASLERRIAISFEGIPAFVVAPEDLILYKTLAGRDRDWIDIEHLVQSVGKEKIGRAHV